MSWYSFQKLIKIAGPKEKIQQFKVTDPCLQFFIMRYDSMIKWGGYTVEDKNGEETPKTIKTQDDINEFLTTQILPKVYAKVDPANPDNNYVKKIDVKKEYLFAKQNNIFNPELEQAYQIAQRDEGEAEKFYLDIVNGVKKQSFDGWINYIKEHPDYQKNPSFIYLLLNPILDSSSSKTKNPPPAVTPPVVAQMLQKIQQAKFKYDGPIKDEKVFKKILALSKEGVAVEEIANQTGVPLADVQDAINQNNSRNIDIFKTYEKDLVDYSLNASKHEFDKNQKAGWLKLPRKDKTQPSTNEKGEPLTAEQVFEENLKILDNFSVPNHWCTTKDMNGPRYLTAGDFWMLIQNGRANVGIRFDQDSIVEIAGDQTYNGGIIRSCPTSYWREITDLIYRENLEDKITAYAKYNWDAILQEKRLNQSFFNEDGTPNIEEIEAFKRELITNPELFSRVTDNEKFAAYPDIMQQLKDTCKQAWFNRIQALQGHDALQMAKEVEENAQKMPDFVLADPAFTGIIHGRLTALYQNNPERIKDVLTKIPNHWNVYPQGKEIFKQAVINKYKNGLYWEANAFGANRKPKKQKDRITIAKIDLEKIQEVIGQFLPELNEDVEYEAAIIQAKNESAPKAIQEGIFTQDMPKELVNQFFLEPNNLRKMIENYADKIINAPKQDYFRKNNSAYLDKYIDKELTAEIPAWARKLPGYQQFFQAAKNRILIHFRKQFVNFDPKNKQNPEIYDAYKKHMLRNNRPVITPKGEELVTNEQRHEDYAIDPVDPLLKQDPDWQRESTNYKGHLAAIITRIKTKPSTFMGLPLDIQSVPEVYFTYIKTRIFSKYMPTKLEIINEYSKLPPFIKEKAEVIKSYIQCVKNMLFQGNQHTKWSVTCQKLDQIAFTDPQIAEYCRNKGVVPQNNPQQPNIVASVDSWYFRAVFASNE